MDNFHTPIVIDGSLGEGGGSILRVGASLACVEGKNVIIKNIRANRPKNPGLRLQHLLGMQYLKELTDGTLNEVKVGSSEVILNPGNSWNTPLSIDITTAGNIGLLSQTLQNALFKAPSKEYVFNFNGGGTYGKWAPGTDYIQNVTYSLFRKMGYMANLKVEKHGFYPKGGAQAQLTITPNYPHYKGIEFEEIGILKKICGTIHVENRLKDKKVAERILTGINGNINPNLLRGTSIDIKLDYCASPSVGVGVDVWLEYENGVVLGIGTILGEKRTTSETVGKNVARKINVLLASDETIDEYAADQILPLLFIIDSPSSFKVNKTTSHLLTNLKILENFYKRKIEITTTIDENCKLIRIR